MALSLNFLQDGSRNYGTKFQKKGAIRAWKENPSWPSNWDKIGKWEGEKWRIHSFMLWTPTARSNYLTFWVLDLRGLFSLEANGPPIRPSHWQVPFVLWNGFEITHFALGFLKLCIFVLREFNYACVAMNASAWFCSISFHAFYTHDLFLVTSIRLFHFMHFIHIILANLLFILPTIENRWSKEKNFKNEGQDAVTPNK